MKNKTIGEMVSEDYRTAEVFERFGIDFCCKGNKLMDEVCEKKGIDKKKLMAELEEVLKKTENTTTDYKGWPLDLLCDYIEKKHHRYVETKTPILKQYLEKIATVHGKSHPELYQIRALFFHSAGDLAAHMKKEELVLFPAIRKMVHSKQEKLALSQPAFGTVQNPVAMMMQEHEVEGNRFREIADLSSNYTPPNDACNTYKVTFSLLKEFEADLHLHIHLENNILFPKALELENGLTRQN